MDIYGETLEELENYFESIGEKKFKAIQVYDWLYKKRVKSFSDMSNIKRTVERENLSAVFFCEFFHSKIVYLE